MRYATQGVFDNLPCFDDLMSFVMLCEYCYENICCMSTNITSKCKLYHVGKKYFIKIRQMYIGFRVFIWTYCIVCVSAKYLPLFYNVHMFHSVRLIFVRGSGSDIMFHTTNYMDIVTLQRRPS